MAIFFYASYKRCTNLLNLEVRIPKADSGTWSYPLHSICSRVKCLFKFSLNNRPTGIVPCFTCCLTVADTGPQQHSIALPRRASLPDHGPESAPAPLRPSAARTVASTRRLEKPASGRALTRHFLWDRRSPRWPALPRAPLSGHYYYYYSIKIRTSYWNCPVSPSKMAYNFAAALCPGPPCHGRPATSPWLTSHPGPASLLRDGRSGTASPRVHTPLLSACPEHPARAPLMPSPGRQAAHVRSRSGRTDSAMCETTTATTTQRNRETSEALPVPTRTWHLRRISRRSGPRVRVSPQENSGKQLLQL